MSDECANCNHSYDKRYAYCPNCGVKSSFAATAGSLASIPHKCPVCDGTGLVSRPPGVAGDAQTWSSMDAAHVCRPCNGQGIIWSKPENNQAQRPGLVTTNQKQNE